MSWSAVVLAVLASYLFGAIPVGFLVVKAVRGVDIRTAGSGNVGATNAGRILGKKGFAIVFSLDVLKGLIPCAVVGTMAGHSWLGGPAPLPVVLCAMAAIAGHNWPVYLGFRGGKGVATSFGVLAYLMPSGFVIGLAVWVVAALVWRYVSLASVLAAIAVPVAAICLNLGQLDKAKYVVGIVVFAGVAVIARHKSNIGRLLSGAERRIGQSKTAMSPRDEAPANEER